MIQYSHLLIDGNNFAYKNFYTHRELNSVVRGEDVSTGIAFGCLSSLVSFKKSWLKPGGAIIVVWDRGYTRKARIYPDYKKKRREGRDEVEYANFITQRKLFELFLKYTSVSSASAEGEEADDVIASLVYRTCSASKKARILIISSDKDMHQLLSDDVHQMVVSRKNKENIYGPTEITQLFGISKPIYFLALQLMMGDSGDEVPGVTGIGIKTAQKILSKCSDEEIMSFIFPHGIKIPLALREWIVKRRKFTSRNTDGNLKRITEFFNMTLQLLKPSTNLDNVKVRRGERNENRLVDLLMEYNFTSLLRNRNIKELLT